MNSRVNILEKLRNHSLFKSLYCSSNRNREKISNVLEFKDDVIYVWNAESGSVHALNLQSLEKDGNENKYQTLELTRPINFEVEFLTVSPIGSNICAWGRKGIAVIELPARWGKLGLFENGKNKIICKSFCLDEKYLTFQTEVKRVRWHPDSLSHLIVLVADNALRIYNTTQGGDRSSLAKVLPVGPKPTARLAGKGLLESLGDTAIDFAIARPNCILLRGNGDLYVIGYGLESRDDNHLVGPLVMYPQAEHNYFEESCSIEVLPVPKSVFPVVIIGTSMGVLLHCVLMMEVPLEQSKPDFDIYVIEIIKLGIGFNMKHNMLPYPCYIYPNINYYSYICVHAGGVHSVSMDFPKRLRRYFMTNADSDLKLLRKRSCANFCVCTVPTGADLAPSPPVGVICLAIPNAVFVLLKDGVVVTRTVGFDDFEEELKKDLIVERKSSPDSSSKAVANKESVTFLMFIKEILSRDRSQPILKFASHHRDMEPQEILEFFEKSKAILQTCYINKQLKVRNMMIAKAKSLVTQMNQQRTWMRDIKGDVKVLHMVKKRIEQKMKKANENDIKITNSCSSLLRSMRATTESSQKKVLNEIMERKKEVDTLAKSLESLKLLVRHEKENITRDVPAEDNELVLGSMHRETIALVLRQNNDMMSNLIEKIKGIKQDLYIQ